MSWDKEQAKAGVCNLHCMTGTISTSLKAPSNPSAAGIDPILQLTQEDHEGMLNQSQSVTQSFQSIVIHHVSLAEEDNLDNEPVCDALRWVGQPWES
jgi:hypothetical protein